MLLTFRPPAERQSNPSSSALNSTCMRRKRIVAGGNPKRGHTSLRIVRYTKKTARPLVGVDALIDPNQNIPAHLRDDVGIVPYGF